MSENIWNQNFRTKSIFSGKKKSLDGPNSQMNMLDEKLSKLEKNKTKSPRLKIKQRWKKKKKE